MEDSNPVTVPRIRYCGGACLLGGLAAGLLLTMGCAGKDRSQIDSSRNQRHIPLTKNIKVLGLPQDQESGFFRGIGVKDSIFITGPVIHESKGNSVSGSNMELQMRLAYVNVAKLLQEYGGTMNNVVREVIFVTDMDAGLAAARKVRPDVYSAQPLVATTIVQVEQMAVPSAMVQIEVTAKLLHSLQHLPFYQKEQGIIKEKG